MNFRFLFLIISFIWMISEILLIVMRQSKNDSKDHDKGSIKWLNITIYISITLAIIFGFTGIGLIRSFISTLPWYGLAFIIAGLIVRWIAIHTLQKYFTTNVAILSDHRIIKSGLYKIIRHPSYLGSIISFFGLGLVLSNWISIIILVVPITIAFLKRIQIEEQVLQSTFGEEYSIYSKMTWRLFPWVY
jgi:protein-S-isoprenylcysteine O-methyltransferase Ste14